MSRTAAVAAAPVKKKSAEGCVKNKYRITCAWARRIVTREYQFGRHVA